MNYKERVLYNGLLFEQIKSLLNTTEIKIYDNSMILKDVFGNCLKIEIAHFKNEKGYEDYKTIKKIEEEIRIEKDKKRR
jgi:hypothetical protein